MRLSNIKYTDDYEIYQILGGEAVSIDLQSGDSVEVIDVEGDQQCSVLAVDSKGSSVMDTLDWSSQPSNNSSKMALDDCSEMLKAILGHNKIKTNNLKGTELFSASSPADSRQSFRIDKDTLCVFDAKGGPMIVDEHDAPTEILINVSRANPTKPSERLPAVSYTHLTLPTIYSV